MITIDCSMCKDDWQDKLVACFEQLDRAMVYDSHERITLTYEWMKIDIFLEAHELDVNVEMQGFDPDIATMQLEHNFSVVTAMIMIILQCDGGMKIR